MATKSKLKISIPELITYVVCGIFAIWGLVYTILGLVVNYIPVKESVNSLKMADETVRSMWGLGFFGWGLILFCVFSAIAAIVLIAKAKNTDKDFEKQQRRAARLQRNKQTTTVDEEKVIDATVTDK